MKTPKLRRGSIPLTVSHPALVQEFYAAKNGFTADNVSTGFGTVWWKCAAAGHVFESAVWNRVRGQRCPYCVGRKVCYETSIAYHYPELAAQWSEQNTKTVEHIWFQSQQQHWWVCDAGHEQKTSIAYRLKNACPYCSDTAFLAGVNDLLTQCPELAKEYMHENTLPAESIFYRSQHVASWQCGVCHHVFKTRVARRTVDGTQCPACAGNVIVEGLNDLTTFAPALVQFFDSMKTGRSATTVGKGRDVWWLCAEGHSFQASPHLLMFRSADRVCRVCHPHSQLEQDVFEAIVCMVPEDVSILRNDRQLIAPYELDMVIPEFNVAIEVNGTYWHSDTVLQQSRGMTAAEYHEMKQQRCREAGYTLYHMWEHEWNTDRVRAMQTLQKIFTAY